MIEITEMRVGDHKVEIPPGLSQLLDGCWVKKRRNQPSKLNAYESESFRENNNLVTVLKVRKRSVIQG